MQRKLQKKSSVSFLNFDFGKAATIAVMGGVGLVVVIGLRSPSSRHDRQVGHRMKQNQANHQAELQRIKEDSEIAHIRYQSGCTMPWIERKDTIQALALSQGTTYSDGSINYRLAPGDLVCDDNGQTGVIDDDGRLTDTRRATDMDLVNQRFADAMGWHEKPRRSSALINDSK